MKYQLAQYTLTGARPENQDRIASVERDNAILMVLADGLGGHSGGGLAAETLVKTATQAFQKIRQPLIEQPGEFLALTIMRAHKRINALSDNDPNLTPRTTCAMCLVQNGYAYWAHVGDSRIYHFHKDKLITRTVDHSTAERVRQNGRWSPADQRHARGGGQLTKCVGGPQRPRITVGEETRLRRDDNLLLCSDGLWHAFNSKTIGRYLRARRLEDAVDELLLDAESRMKEACDNLSAVALRWEDTATISQPLNPDASGEIEFENLQRAAVAMKKLPAESVKADVEETAPGRKPRVDPRAVKDAIDEIDQFIRQLENTDEL